MFSLVRRRLVAEVGAGAQKFGEQGISGNATTVSPAGAAAPTGTPANPTAATQNEGSNYGISSYNTTGWYITLGVVTSIALANVPVVGPALLGILSIALIYQVGLLLQGQ